MTHEEAERQYFDAATMARTLEARLFEQVKRGELVEAIGSAHMLGCLQMRLLVDPVFEPFRKRRRKP